MLPNNFIFSQTESLFQQKLDSNEIKNTAIAFMADTGRIWTHGTWFCTSLTAEDIQNLIDQSITLKEFIQALSPAEVAVSDTQPTGEEKIWINGNTISFNNGGVWSAPINLDNYLSKNNTLEYTPVADYNPATKKYVDDQITERDNVLIIDATSLVGSPVDGDLVDSLITASQNGKAVILRDDTNLINVEITYDSAANTLTLHTEGITKTESGYDLAAQDIVINTLDNTLTSNTTNTFSLVDNGDGLQYLSNDGTYKVFPDMATVVELNAAVLSLTNDSSSEDIIAAFDSAAEFSNLIAQIRDSDNIVNEVLLDTDGYIGHINASLIVSKTDEVIHIRFIDNNDNLVLITITNNAGTFSCTRTENDMTVNVNLINEGDGTKFLSDDGTYKTIEVGDKTNVLILSLENDLANGQKDSPVDAEVSTALKDAISTGKACVIKSANSDILANLQQTGDNVTIVMEQISRLGQTFVAVNTTITVNTVTNVISDYQTGAIVLETEGDGSKFLSNNGTYKEIPQPDLSNYLAKNNTIEFTPTSDYQPATKKYVDDNFLMHFETKDGNDKSGCLITKDNHNFNIEGFIGPHDDIESLPNGEYRGLLTISIGTETDLEYSGGGYRAIIPVSIRVSDTEGIMMITDFTHPDASIIQAVEYSNSMYRVKLVRQFSVDFGQDDELYVDIPVKFKFPNPWNESISIPCHWGYDKRILTESEYAALGTTPETDNVLYFITPD